MMGLKFQRTRHRRLPVQRMFLSRRYEAERPVEYPKYVQRLLVVQEMQRL